jgi:hypothetical protein
MLSVDAPALTIFGSMSPQIIQTASQLAELSGFPVTIRPAKEDPSASVKWVIQPKLGTVYLFAANAVIMILGYNESSNNGWQSSGSQMNVNIDVKAQGNHGSSSHDASTQRQRSKRPVGGGDHPDEMPEDDKGDPPDPPDPDADMHLLEVTHDTNIRLKILVNSKDKGDFLELETSVKVCLVVQHLKSSLIRYSFTLSLTRRNYRTATRA